jgi:hypothetical protein
VMMDFVQPILVMMIGDDELCGTDFGGDDW